MRITEFWLTDEGCGPTVPTYEEAAQITAEHNFAARPQQWFQAGTSGANCFPTRAEAEAFAGYVRSVSMGG